MKKVLSVVLALMVAGMVFAGGNKEGASPWTSKDLIANTTGIDVVLDSHSHDLEQMVIKNKDGKDVVRSITGTKLSAVGYSLITVEKGIEKTDVWVWNNVDDVPSVFGFKNKMSEKVNASLERLKETINKEQAMPEIKAKIWYPFVYDISKVIKKPMQEKTNKSKNIYV